MPLNPVRSTHKALGPEAWEARLQRASVQLHCAETPMQTALATWKHDTYAAARIGAVLATPVRALLGEGSAKHVEQSLACDLVPPETGSPGLVNGLGFVLHQSVVLTARGIFGWRTLALEGVLVGLRNMVALPCGAASLAVHAMCVASALLIGAAYGLVSGAVRACLGKPPRAPEAVRARSSKPPCASEAARLRLRRAAVGDVKPRGRLAQRIQTVAQAGTVCGYIEACSTLRDSENARLTKRFGAANALADVLQTQAPQLRRDAADHAGSLAALTRLWKAEHAACNSALAQLMEQVHALHPIAVAMPQWQPSVLPLEVPNWVPEGQPVTVRTPKELKAISLFYQVTLKKLCASQKYLGKVSGKFATTARLLQSAADGSAWQPPAPILPVRRSPAPVGRAPGPAQSSAVDWRAQLS